MTLEREMIGLIGLGVLFLLLLVRMPVGLAMVAVGIGGNFALSQTLSYLRFEPYLKQFKTLFWTLVSNYELSVVPLFILMGYLASQSRMSVHLFEGLNALVGRFRGGVAMAAIGASAAFGAVCGWALAAGGARGIWLPPSVVLGLYSIIVEASIVQMFQAAILPGLMAVGFFVLVVGVRVRRNPALAPTVSRLTPTESRQALWRLLPVVAVLGTLILGLGLGLFTPTPAAAVGATAVLVYGALLTLCSREPHLTLGGLGTAIRQTATTSAMIMLILFGAEVLKGFFSRAGLPAALAGWVASSGLDPWLLLVLLLVVLIVLGCFMDSLSLVLVAVPFFWPSLVGLNGGDFVTAAASPYGVDSEQLKIWFGILVLVVVELGLITPPVGLNVFMISAIARDVPMTTIFRGVMPFFAIELLRVGLLLLFPGIILVVVV